MDVQHMGNFLNNLGQKLATFMIGRNGVDTLAQWSIGVGIVCLLLDFLFGPLTGLPIFSWLSLAFLIYACFRMYSKNIASRALENARFQAFIRGPQAKMRSLSARYKNRKTTKYLKCPKCGQSLSVPKGKGTLRVTCPKCGTKTTTKS